MGPTNQEVVSNHDARNRPEQPGVANEPPKDIASKGAHQLPRHHGEPQQASDQATSAKTDQPRSKIRKVIRRRDDIRPDVYIERRNQ